MTLLQRVIDYIPLTIEHELNHALADNLQNSLFQNLFGGPDAPTVERMRELLGEDPATAASRESLQVRKSRLLEIKQRLDEFTNQA